MDPTGIAVEYGHMAWLDEAEAQRYATIMRYQVLVTPCHLAPTECPIQQGIAKGLYADAVPIPEPQGSHDA
jgi:hypothetical protein